jgi:hypothetical protein
VQKITCSSHIHQFHNIQNTLMEWSNPFTFLFIFEICSPDFNGLIKNLGIWEIFNSFKTLKCLKYASDDPLYIDDTFLQIGLHVFRFIIIQQKNLIFHCFFIKNY